MANKHTSALNPAAEKWKTHRTPVFPLAYFTDQHQMCKYFSFSRSNTQVTHHFRRIDVSYKPYINPKHKRSTWNGNCKWDVFPSKTQKCPTELVFIHQELIGVSLQWTASLLTHRQCPGVKMYATKLTLLHSDERLWEKNFFLWNNANSVL